MHTYQQNFLAQLQLRNDGVPIYVQIREQFLAAIATGALTPGSRLPTMREVAVALKIDLNTVRHAYDEMQRRGAIELVRGRGSFVANQPSPAPIDADPLDKLALSAIAQSLEAGFAPAELAHRILRLCKGV
ncbi:MAG TPA: GntR family transcriptional regulator [Magnetospirillaceae bacterium]|nr:GntR family transcriptional regulator [Magnetospirillaceae bacterium]